MAVMMRSAAPKGCSAMAAMAPEFDASPGAPPRAAYLAASDAAAWALRPTFRECIPPIVPKSADGGKKKAFLRPESQLRAKEGFGPSGLSAVLSHGFRSGHARGWSWTER